VFLVDQNTPPETPMAVMYACVLFAAGALLPPGLASLIGAATLGVYVVDGWVSPSGWTLYRALGLVALLAAGLWALRTGADHARLRAKALGPVSPVADDEALQLLRALLIRTPELDHPRLVLALRESIERLEASPQSGAGAG
jgi:hypothetical protein